MAEVKVKDSTRTDDPEKKVVSILVAVKGSKWEEKADVTVSPKEMAKVKGSSKEPKRAAANGLVAWLNGK